MSFVRWRLFIGPPFTRPSSAVHWDWSSIVQDAAYTPTSAATTLSSSATPGATTVSVGSTSAFPSSGGFWVGTTRWSYVRYSGKTGSSFTGCTWTGDAEEQTTHNSGASVLLWLPVTENNGRLNFEWSMTSNLAASSWEAKIGGGVKIPQSAIRNNHAALVQRATTTTGSFTNYLMGWLASPTFSMGRPSVGQWTATIVSSAQKIAEIAVKGVRVGDLNIAKEGSASAISTLAGPYKERNSGEYVAAEPELGPQSAIDGDMTTLWISEDVIGTPQTFAVSNDPTTQGFLVISQIHIDRHPGMPTGYEWIELTCTVTGSHGGVALWADTQDSAFAGINGSYTLGDKIIICTDEVLFNDQNPRHGAAKVVSLNGGTFLSGLSATGGAIGVYYTTQFTEGWHCDAIWGTGTEPDRGVGETNRFGPSFTGGNIPAPTPGETIRYTFANSATPKNNYTNDYNDHAGYNFSADDGYDEPWFAVELPEMGLMLGEDIASSFTGTVLIKTDSGFSTGGLPSSGSIVIGDNIITFTSKTSTTIDITGGVTDAHVAGDKVYVYFSSVASDGVPINSIEWEVGGSTYFKNFNVYYSRYPDARSPGAANYLDDYTSLASVTGHASSTYTLTFSTTRATKVLILPTLMNADPARMRLNEVRILLDRTYYDTAQWLADATPVATLFSTLLQDAYIPTGAITATDDTLHNMSDLETTDQNAWSVVVDLADFSNHYLQVTRDSKISVAANDFWTTGTSYTSDETWTTSNAREPRLLEDGTGTGTVKQVQLWWKSASGASEGVEVYPASGSEDWRGSVLELGPFIFANSTDAQAAARKQYYLRKYPYKIFIEPRVPGDYAPGQIHRVQWAFSDSWATVDRYCMVTGISETFENMNRTQSISLIIADREVPN